MDVTEFKYNNLQISSDTMDDESQVLVEADVTNTGKCEGKEVVQLYVADKNGTVNRPVKELRGFTKISLLPGETRRIQMKISARDLSFYHEELQGWYAPSGKYELLIGHASDEILLSGEITFTTKKQLPFHVTRATTIGELLADPRTAAMTMEMLAPIQQGAAVNEADDGSDDQLLQALLDGLPLKSLAILGVSGEMIDQMVNRLNQICE